MKLQRKISSILAAMLIPAALLAQCPPTAHDFLDINQVKAAIGNGGEPFGVDGVPNGYNVPANTNLSPLYSSSLWIGGLDASGGLFVSASTYRQSGHEFYAGPVRLNQNYNCATGFDQKWQKVWKVTKAEVNQFRLDFQNGTVNFANYPDIETWPGNGDVSQTEDASLAPFVDVNQDGLYRPMQNGDYPCFPGDMGLWWVYNADGPHNETGSSAFPLQFENLAFAYDCSTGACDSTLDYVTFFHRTITNKSNISLNNVYLSIFMDVEIGRGIDDYIGSDSLRGLAFGYNGPATDQDYGFQPPAFGSLHLSNSTVPAMSGMMYYNNDFSQTGNPEIALDFYGYMQSKWKDGSPLVDDGGTGYGSGPSTKYAFSGDAGYCGGPFVGWTENSSNNVPWDRRLIQNFGPISLPAGGRIELDNAFIYARGYYNDALGSVCELKNAADYVAGFWADSVVLPCTQLPLGIAEGAQAARFELYPNPSTGKVWLQLEEPSMSGAVLRLIDMQGRTLMAQGLPTGTRSKEIDLDEFPNGVYLLQIQSEAGLMNKKIILSR